MKIQYIAPSPKAGTIEHVSQQVGQTLVAAGFATAVPFPRRDGSPEWMAAIAEEDAARKPSHHDTVGALPPGEIQWSVRELASGKAVIVKQTGGEIQFIDAITPDTPESTRRAFVELCSVNPEANSAALAAAKRLGEEQERKDKTAGRLSVLSAMFGNKKL